MKVEWFFNELGSLVLKRRRVIIAVGLVLIAVSLFGATKITVATGPEIFLSTDSEAYMDYDRFNQYFGSSVIVVMITGENTEQLLHPDNLRAMEYIENRMLSNRNVISVISPAFYIRMSAIQQSGVASLTTGTDVATTMATNYESGQISPTFNKVLPDENHALIAITLVGGISRTAMKEVVEETETAVTEAHFIGVDAVVTGGPPLTSTIEDLITKNMGMMFIVSIFLMFVILVFIFRVRGFFAWRWLPLGEVGIAIIYTFGAMGLLGIPITMVSMAVFPILIGLGVDYSIQLHNRYDEETVKGKPLAICIKDTVTHIGPAMGIALIAMCLGFAAMMFSPVPMVRDFGLMLIIGVIACYFVAMLFPLTILYWRDHRHTQESSDNQKLPKESEVETSGFIERRLQKLAPSVIRHPKVIIIITLALTVAGFFSDPYVTTETDWIKLISEDVPVVKNYVTLEEVTSGSTALNMLVEAEDVTDPDTISWMLRFEDQVCSQWGGTVSSVESIAQVVSQVNSGVVPSSSQQIRYSLEMVPDPIKQNLITGDCTAANIVINVNALEQDEVRELETHLTESALGQPQGVDLAITGDHAINLALLDSMSSGRLEITLIGLGFVFGALLLLFKFNILRTLIAILPIALIISWSSGLMYITGVHHNPLTATLGALILAIGVEYTILLMMRYYEERSRGQDPSEATTIAMRKIGRAIIASGLTDIGGFIALLAAMDFFILRNFGMVTVINIFLALVNTLIVLPAILVWIESWREKRRLGVAHSLSSDNS